jgi:hypothetical protein
MGQIAKIVDYRTVQRSTTRRKPLFSSLVRYPDLARLIPGSASALSLEQLPTVQLANRVLADHAGKSLLGRLAKELVPRFARRVQPRVIMSAALDSWLIAVVFFVQQALGGAHLAAITLPTLFAYLAAYMIFSIEEGVYSQPSAEALSQTAAASRSLAFAALLASFVAKSMPGQGHLWALIIFSLVNLCALSLRRHCWRFLSPGGEQLRNVLIVGSGARAQEVSSAIHRDGGSRRLVKGFMAEHHLRNIYGASMLSRIAREEFVDEIIIASADDHIAEIAIQEARRNNLDVKVAPQASIASSCSEIEFENVGGVPLLKIESLRQPECKLAIKRVLDAAVGLSALIALSPLYLLIAMLIRLDSPGSILYRAPRVGSKGQRFTCYKFRTMVPEAMPSRAICESKMKGRAPSSKSRAIRV